MTAYWRLSSHSPKVREVSRVPRRARFLQPRELTPSVATLTMRWPSCTRAGSVELRCREAWLTNGWARSPLEAGGDAARVIPDDKSDTASRDGEFGLYSRMTRCLSVARSGSRSTAEEGADRGARTIRARHRRRPQRDQPGRPPSNVISDDGAVHGDDIAGRVARSGPRHDHPGYGDGGSSLRMTRWKSGARAMREIPCTRHRG